MLTENTILNIVQAWAEETLDHEPCFRETKVIRAHQDGPEPMQARIDGIPTDGTSLFVTIDITGDDKLPGYPLYCECVSEDGLTIERTRNVLREVTLSISAYRRGSIDAAKALIANVQGRTTQVDFFLPHGMAFKEVSGVAVLNEIILEQWERRAQFTLTLSYVETVVECDPVMKVCVPACAPEGECFACEEKETGAVCH